MSVTTPKKAEVDRGGADDAESVKPLLFSVSETCKMLGLSQSSIYVLISKGELETVRFASVDSVRITRESITRLLNTGRSRRPRAHYRKRRQAVRALPSAEGRP
jgi:excisionase family DNA binding protein